MERGTEASADVDDRRAEVSAALLVEVPPTPGGRRRVDDFSAVGLRILVRDGRRWILVSNILFC